MIKKTKDIPPGVSEWKEAGLKYGYWRFFEEEVRLRRENELYVVAEMAIRNGLTFERYLKAWATILSNKENEKSTHNIL